MFNEFFDDHADMTKQSDVVPAELRKCIHACLYYPSIVKGREGRQLLLQAAKSVETAWKNLPAQEAWEGILADAKGLIAVLGVTPVECGASVAHVEQMVEEQNLRGKHFRNNVL